MTVYSDALGRHELRFTVQPGDTSGPRWAAAVEFLDEVTAGADRAWVEDAVCATADPDLWFPEKGGNAEPARRLCRTCPVVTPCAAAGAGDRFGVWGGLTPGQRARRARPAS